MSHPGVCIYKYLSLHNRILFNIIYVLRVYNNEQYYYNNIIITVSWRTIIAHFTLYRLHVYDHCHRLQTFNIVAELHKSARALVVPIIISHYNIIAALVKNRTLKKKKIIKIKNYFDVI